MFRLLPLCLIFAQLLIAAPVAHGQGAIPAWDDHPGIGYDPQSTAAAPCGTGTPPRGHFPPEIAADAASGPVELTVRQDAHRLCYVADGIADAPVIRVRQGQELAITLRNEIADPAAIDHAVAIQPRDVPLAAVPEAAGYVPVVPGSKHPATGATNLHVHGFAVPPVAPQDEVMMRCADPASGSAACGTRSLDYRYSIPADMPAGLYWYHPHVHGEVQGQMLLGLAGAIVVEGPDDDARRAAGIEDRIFVIRQAQDIDVKQTPPPLPPGVTLAVPPPPVPHPRPAPGAEAIETDHELPCSDSTGVDRISLNGAKVQDGRVRDVDLASLQIPAGSVQLWRVLNAATDAFLDLAVIDQTGKPVPLQIVARDGAPLIDDQGNRPAPATVTDYQLVPPAGRLEFLVPAPPPGQKAYFVSHRVDTGCAGDQVPERKLAILTAGPPAASQSSFATANAATPGQSADLFSHLLAEPTKTVRTLVMAEYPRPGAEDRSDFYIAEKRPGAVLKPFAMGDGPTITTEAGAVEEWIVENWTNELHAFHLHQVHFRVLEVNGKRLDSPPLLDTVTVPFATSGDVNDGRIPVVPGSVRIKVAFPEALAGDILFHCHLVDHEDAGMMGVLRVLPAAGVSRVQKAELPTGTSLAELLAHPPICRGRVPDETATTAD